MTFAVIVQVKVENFDAAAAKEEIDNMAIPMIKKSGATSAYWLMPADGRVTVFALFEDEATARKSAAGLPIGGQAGMDPGTTFESTAVRAVLTHT